MNKFTVKLKPFGTSNKGGVTHNQIHQSEFQRQHMLDIMEDFLLLFNKLPALHHKNKLRRIGLDPAKDIKWHIKELTKNNKGRRDNIKHLIYEADVLRHNNVVEDVVNQLDNKGNTSEQLKEVLDEYWILLDENKKLSAAERFHKLYK